ncbi:IS3 family transposase [Gloeobacter morelensis]|uniref:IS3 family transposase n=1 Tax=Gloeobacter morelensis MG652769 TaxID=2781736 RepID=A0ABY3PH45_9CYAN|nr:IS3 family transposase [Gloeobacter morelensis]UFP92980.1 IS3 family transposase [Gloeobacter morelensis MG652769]
MLQLVAEESDAGAELSIAQACRTLGLSRAEYYRCKGAVHKSDSDMEVRVRIQAIALEWPSYGSGRIRFELQRQGLTVNRKRVQRLMREDNLLCLRKQKFVKTTDSEHGLSVYPNLAAGLQLSGIDQLWVADLTYIRLSGEFVYLAVILDAFSRRVIGWSLERFLDAGLAVLALRMAITSRSFGSELVHHSDRGVQYASKEYTDILKERGIQISMSRRANPYDNAKAESFMKTLKYEEVYMFEYENMTEARNRIGDFLEEVYNQKRLHSSIGYLPPAEFEQRLTMPDPA